MKLGVFGLFLALLSCLRAELTNLNQLKKSYVLDVKRIHIPGFPYAFNPSIVSWKGKLLMSFRSYNKNSLSTDAIYLVWLDKNFEPMSTPSLLKRENEVASIPSRAQDPRLIVVNDSLYIVYSNTYPKPIDASRMVVGRIEEEGENDFSLSFPSHLIYYPNQIKGRKEKNWVPFAYENELFLSYSLQPHRIFKPFLDLNSCGLVCSTIGTIEWKWGRLLGGTPALCIGDSYLGFFHSNKAMATVQSNGKVLNHYFMGAYTFEAKYPFSITAISSEPIVAKKFYEGEMYEGKTWKPLRVVFPAGVVLDDDFIWVSYGRQDHESWVVKLDRKKLLKSLTPVNLLKEILP